MDLIYFYLENELINKLEIKFEEGQGTTQFVEQFTRVVNIFKENLYKSNDFLKTYSGLVHTQTIKNDDLILTLFTSIVSLILYKKELSTNLIIKFDSKIILNIDLSFIRKGKVVLVN